MIHGHAKIDNRFVLQFAGLIRTNWLKPKFFMVLARNPILPGVSGSTKTT
jgi:hypothetical protein